MVVFVALELDEGVREIIHRYVREMVKPMCRGGRWVDSSNYHLTLKYIGNVKEREVDALYRLLNEAASRYDGFRLCTGRIGVFGGAGTDRADTVRARVLWLDTGGDLTALKCLRRYIEERAVALGFKEENRFSPHITLARDVLLTRRPDEVKRLKPVSIDVSSVSLMESRLEGGRRVYIPLSVHRLGKVVIH